MTLDIMPFTSNDDRSSGSSSKRAPSPSFQGPGDEISRKRFKEDTSADTKTNESSSRYITLIENLAQELQCGCCTGLVYRPVVVLPCQHFFCGRYVVRLIVFALLLLRAIHDR